MVSLLQAMRAYLGRLCSRPPAPHIVDVESLQHFLESRASHVTQTSLYGYLRTRAGSRYPELFANEDFAKAINEAKWNIWLACVSDLAIYAGGLIARSSADGDVAASRVMRAVIGNILNGKVPLEAGSAYPALAAAVRERVNSCPWRHVADNGTVFSESPAALVRWAPIMDQLMQLDADIVRNSVRFRWQEVRQELRRLLNAEALQACAVADPLKEAGGTPVTRA